MRQAGARGLPRKERQCSGFDPLRMLKFQVDPTKNCSNSDNEQLDSGCADINDFQSGDLEVKCFAVPELDALHVSTVSGEIVTVGTAQTELPDEILYLIGSQTGVTY